MNLEIAFIAIFTITEALSDAFIFKDFRERGHPERSQTRGAAATEVTQSNKAWHMAQAARQGAAMAFSAWCAGYWPLAVIAAAAFWIVHDVIVNTVGLDRHPFYVGNTAAIDRFFQRFDNPERAMGITKFAILTAAIGLTLIFKP